MSLSRELAVPGPPPRGHAPRQAAVPVCRGEPSEGCQVEPPPHLRTSTQRAVMDRQSASAPRTGHRPPGAGARLSYSQAYKITAVSHPTMEGSIQHSPFPSVFDMAPSHHVVMKSDASKFIVSYFDIAKNRLSFAYLGPFQILKIAGPSISLIPDPHMHPGICFWDIRKK